VRAFELQLRHRDGWGTWHHLSRRVITPRCPRWLARAPTTPLTTPLTTPSQTAANGPNGREWPHGNERHGERSYGLSGAPNFNFFRFLFFGSDFLFDSHRRRLKRNDRNGDGTRATTTTTAAATTTTTAAATTMAEGERVREWVDGLSGAPS
jgi:hypothetical protein